MSGVVMGSSGTGDPNPRSLDGPDELVRPRHGSGAAVAFYVAAVVGVATVLWAPSAFGLMIGAVSGMLGSLLVFEWRRIGHPLTPVGIIALGGLLIFVLRPLTVVSSGATTAGAKAETQAVSSFVLHAACMSLQQVVLYLAGLGLAYLVWISRPTSVTASRLVLSRESASSQQLRRAKIMLVASLVLAVACSLQLIQSAGGLGAYLDGLSVRSSFLAGKYYLTLAYIPASIALCLFLVLLDSSGRRRVWTPFVWVATIITLLAAFTGGGRGPVLLGVILPLLIVKQSGRRPLGPGILVILGAALLAGAMVMSIYLRDNVYTKGTAAADFQEDPVAALGQRLTSGTETRPFDSLIVLNEAELRGDLELQHGTTYAATVKWILPGALAGSKGGGNTWFTRTYVPSYYYPDHVETSLSAPGEAYANFGFAGPPVVGLLTGVAAAAFTRRMVSRTLYGLVVTAKLTPMFFSFIRGDAYQNVSLSIILIVATYAMVRIAQLRPEQLSERTVNRRLRTT